jgi:hypothetical protein
MRASLAAWWTGSAPLRVRMRRAATGSLLVHAVSSLCAAGFVLPLAASVPEQALAEQPAVGALFTAVRVFDTLIGSPLRYGAVPGFLMLVLAPFLQVLWLRAQLVAAAVHEHARAAAHVYKDACFVYLASSAYAGVLLAAALGVARCCEWLLHFSHNLRLQQTTGIVLAAPLVLAALLHAPCLCDQAQLALARGERWSRALVLDTLRSVDLRMCSLRAGFAAGSATLVLVTLLPRMWLGTTASTGLWLFALSQLTAAARTLVRGAWLAWLAERATAPVAEPAAESGGTFEPQELS